MALTREIWRQRWLSSINELTSSNLQKKSWLDKQQTNPHWSFVEFMNCYFDDLLCDFPYEHFIKIDWVSIEEYSVLKPWHEALDKYTSPNNDDYDVEAILKDRKWHKILNSGEAAKNNLAGMINSDEQKILNEVIDYTQYT